MNTYRGNKIYVQYGCGRTAPVSWQNFDSSPTLLFEKIPIVGKLYTKNETRFEKHIRYGDIVKGLPFHENTVYAIYASHVLEHLALDEFRSALNNSYKILCPGGIFRFIVPDLEKLAKDYIESEKEDASIEFLKKTALGRQSRKKAFFKFFLEWIGNSKHLMMWDYKSLIYELNKVGFVNMRRCFFNDSKDRMFDEVEDADRYTDAVGIECQKK
jgi:SAM-dependent methyltransferase